MNAPTRREQIEAMLAETPGDIFLRYSLAMEWEKEGENEKSLAGLRELMADDPPYAPAFFMAGKQLVGLRRTDEARSVFRDGIEEARRQGDAHAAEQMGDLLKTLDSAEQ
jgi:hypothetical protein